jgi:hypothetical protein
MHLTHTEEFTLHFVYTFIHATSQLSYFWFNTQWEVMSYEELKLTEPCTFLSYMKG